jgi:hypothetical protein
LKEPGYPKDLAELSLKIIVRLGIVRANVEDFLVVSNLLLAKAEFASVDLREEIRALPVSGKTVDKDGKKTVSLHADDGLIRCTTETAEGLDDLAISTGFASWTTDDEFLICVKDGLTRYRIPTQSNEAFFFHDKATDCELPESSKICYFKNQILVRNPDFTDGPVQYYCPRTLTLQKEQTDRLKYSDEKDPSKPSEDFDKETGRKMLNGPFFTDGHSLYLVSLKKHVSEENKDQEEDKEAVPTAIVIEEFNAEFKHVKSVVLYKNEERAIFVQKSESD